MIALEMGFDPMQAGAIGIIGGADGPTAIFLSSKLAPKIPNCAAAPININFGLEISAEEFEPMLLIPIGFGMLIGNIPFNMDAGL